MISSYRPGSRVKISLLRGDKELDVYVRLADKAKSMPNYERNINQNTMGGRLSVRRVDFKQAFQHDSVLTPSECGGPILNLEGEVVGINIARSGRVESLALPANLLVPVIDSLKTGQFKPAVVNKKEIEEIKVELKELDSQSRYLPRKTEKLRSKYDREAAREEELKKLVDDLQARLDELKKSRSEAKSEWEKSAKKLSTIEKDQERLEAQLKRLTTGVK